MNMYAAVARVAQAVAIKFLQTAAFAGNANTIER